MPSLFSQIESVLFVASKALSSKKIAKVLSADEQAVEAELGRIAEKYNMDNSGIVLLRSGDDYRLVSHPDNRAVAEHFIKAEISGELTRPQLETLTVISYCGPITKPELEQIRGVNCSLILRNLMMRGLIREADGGTGLLPSYEVTMEYLQHLGIAALNELPDYAELHNHEFITDSLNKNAVSEENK